MPKKSKPTVEEAEEILREEMKKQKDLFLQEYMELCKKHGMELQPNYAFVVVPLK